MDFVDAAHPSWMENLQAMNCKRKESMCFPTVKCDGEVMLTRSIGSMIDFSIVSSCPRMPCLTCGDIHGIFMVALVPSYIIYAAN